MALEVLWRLGLGVALAWAALPWLARLARRSRAAPPAHYYRALLLALGIATLLIFAPLVRGWSGSWLRALEASSAAPPPYTITFVAELVSPLVATSTALWPAAPMAQLFAAIGGIWLLLLAAGLTLSIAGRLRLQRAYGAAAAAPARVLTRAERAADELRVHTPQIRVADGPATAFTYGAWSPVIVISPSACALPDDELDFVLRHELCHVARHDTRVMHLIDIAQRCFLGHPSLPALAHEIRVAREARADEAAASGHALEYARFLLTIATHIHAVRAQSSFVSMADTALERRVEMLIDPNRSRLRRSTPWLVLTGLALASIIFLTPASSGQPERAANDHPIVQGNLTVEQVEQALFKNAQPMLDCYNNLAGPRANLSVHLSFVIDESGRVSSGRVSAPDQTELEPCLRAALLQRTFPRPTSGTVSVEAPTLLTPPYEERLAVLEAREGTSQRLSRDVIRTTLRGHLPQLRECFERLQGALPSAKINMNFIIDRDGHSSDGQTVDTSEPAADSAVFTQLAQCVDDVRRTMTFPAPGDGIVTVNYPMEFGHTQD